MLSPTNVDVAGLRFNLTPIPVLRASRLDKKVLTLIAPVLGPLLGGDLKAEVDLSKVGGMVASALSLLPDEEFTGLLRDLMASVIYLPEGAPPVPLNDEAGLNLAFTGNLVGMYQLAVAVMRFNKFSFFAGVRLGGGTEATASSPVQHQG